MTAAPAICVLASGSAGNCTALRRPDGGVTLLDAGLSPRRTRQRLGELGVSWCAVTDILLTHVDSDHFNGGWPKALVHRPDVAVHLAVTHARQLERSIGCPSGVRAIRPDRDGRFVAELTGAAASGMPLPHDRDGTVGWRIEVGNAAIGLATDLGHVPDAFDDHFAALDALLLESNYDPPMQRAAPRPPALKARIMGGHGHLSNEQSLDAARRLTASGTIQHIVLLHLSRQCNCPTLVRELWQRTAPELAERLTVTDQHQPTRWLTIDPERRVVPITVPPNATALRRSVQATLWAHS